MRRLFLDDYRDPIHCAEYMYRRGVDCRIYHERWDIVRSYGQFVDYIKNNGVPEMIGFDHDLADTTQLLDELPIDQYRNIAENREYTGLDCAKFIVEYCLENKLPLPICIVHSMNPIGRENIESYINNVKKHLGL